MRLIDADEVRKHAIETYQANGVELEPIIMVPLDAINNAPTVTPQPKTGHWVEENISAGCRRVYCSECGCAPPFEYVSTGDVYSASGYGVINKTKFCPDCGADMRDNKKETTFDDYLNKQLKDPEFRKEWEKLCDEDKHKGGEE